MAAIPAMAPRRRSSSPSPPRGDCRRRPHAFFARAGLELVQGRGARDYRGAIAGLAGRRGRLCLVGRDRRPARRRRRAFRRRRRGSGAREGSGRRGAARAFKPARLRPRQCRGRGAQGVDRRAHHGRSRRCRFGLSRQARRAHAGRDKIRQSHPPLFRRAWNRRLPHCREPRRDRRARPHRARRSSSSTSPPPARRSKPMRSKPWTTERSCARRRR